MNDEITQDVNNIPELQTPLEQLCEKDAEGREWWNSRKLACVMGYGKYWNFERVIAKAQAWVTQNRIKCKLTSGLHFFEKNNLFCLVLENNFVYLQAEFVHPNRCILHFVKNQ